MAEQMNIFEAGKVADKNATYALEKAERVAHSWVEMADRAGRVLASRRRPFTSLDVYTQAGPPPDNVDPRALGGIFRRLEKQGLIKPIGYMPNPTRHNAPSRVWIGK